MEDAEYYGLADYELSDYESEEQREERYEREDEQELWETVNS